MLSAAQKLPPGEGAPGEDQAAGTLGTMAAPVWQDPPMRSAAQKLPPGEGAPGAEQAAGTANGISLPRNARRWPVRMLSWVIHLGCLQSMKYISPYSFSL